MKTPEDIRFYQCFGEILREAREEKFVTLQTAAEVAEVSYEQMERIEAGAEITCQRIDQLARHLEVPVNELFARCEARMKEK